MDWTTADNFGGSEFALHPHRTQVPHEFDTTANLDGDGGAGTLAEPMVMIYWWGKVTAPPNNYKWVSTVRDNVFRYQASARTCGNERRIPKYIPNVTQDITLANC